MRPGTIRSGQRARKFPSNVWAVSLPGPGAYNAAIARNQSEPPMPPSTSALRTEHLPGLLARWRQGDAVAADELIRRVTPRLECLARQMLRRYPVVRGQVQTADVMQEA